MSTYQTTSCRELPKSDLKEYLWSFSDENLVIADPKGIDKAKALKITVYFMKESPGYTEEKHQIVWNSIKKDKVYQGRETWEHYANVCFEEVTTPERANIRVGFHPDDGNWSYIGQEATKHDGITLNLETLKHGVKGQPDTADFGIILHEFGHVLGLAHEHQSPLRGSDVSRLLRQHSGEYSRRYGSKDLVESQMMKMIGADAVENSSSFDPESIMMYEIHGITEKPNTELSKVDKAFIMLDYPPDLTDYGDNNASAVRMSRLTDAIRVTGLEASAGEILHAFVDPAPVLKLQSGTEVTLSHKLEAVRQRFGELNRLMHDLGRNLNEAHSGSSSSTKQFFLQAPRSKRLTSFTDPTLTKQFGLTDPLRDVAKNKFLRSLIKIGVRNALELRGVSVEGSIPGVAPTEVTRMMAAISMDTRIADHVKAYKADFQGGGLAETTRAPNREDDVEART